MFETMRDMLIHTTEESIVILLSLLSILFIFLVIYWQYNRRRFQKLSHQIPAGVIRDYLDSVIQNSSALKSSLFLGENSGSDKASVVSMERLSESNVGEDSFEELSRKNAEIAELRNGISIKDKIIAELEGKLANGNSKKNVASKRESKALQIEVERLKKELQQQNSGNSLSKDELNKLVQERDSLRDSLKEYEIIEDDLANLKLLQEENRRYRKMIEEMGGTPPKEIFSEPKKSEVNLPEVPEIQEDIKKDNKPKEKNVKNDDKQKGVSAENNINDKNDDDSADSEELLKEFEKMLG